MSPTAEGEGLDASAWPARRRKSHRKSRSGCSTCKDRRVRCDETRPKCRRCAQSNIVCGGYASSVAPKVVYQTADEFRDSLLALPSQFNIRPLVMPVLDTVLENPTIQSFQTYTLPELRLAFRCELWEGHSLLEIGHSNDVIMHMISAISIYHMRLMREGLGSWQKATHFANDDSNNETMSHALDYYAKALRLMIQLVGSPSPNLDLIKLGCVLLAILDFFRGSRMTLLSHLVHGVEVSNIDRRGQEPSSYGSVTDALLSRISFLQSLYGRPRRGRFPSLHRMSTPSRKLDDTPFGTLEQAHDILVDISTSVLDFVRRTYYSLELPSAKDLQEQSRLSVRLQQWLACSKLVLEDARKTDRWREAEILHVQYITAEIFVKTATTKSEMSLDEHSDLFRSIVDTAERIARDISVSQPMPPLFSFDMGLIASLFVTAIRCRDGEIRRKAVAILRLVPVREGVWDAHEAALIAEEAIRWEERNMDPDTNLIPDEGRIYDIDVENISSHNRSILQIRFRHKAKKAPHDFEDAITTIDLADTMAKLSVGDPQT